jgi:hypothetical protein
MIGSRLSNQRPRALLGTYVEGPLMSVTLF